MATSLHFYTLITNTHATSKILIVWVTNVFLCFAWTIRASLVSFSPSLMLMEKFSRLLILILTTTSWGFGFLCAFCVCRLLFSGWYHSHNGALEVSFSLFFLLWGLDICDILILNIYFLFFNNTPFLNTLSYFLKHCLYQFIFCTN